MSSCSQQCLNTTCSPGNVCCNTSNCNMQCVPGVPGPTTPIMDCALNTAPGKCSLDLLTFSGGQGCSSGAFSLFNGSLCSGNVLSAYALNCSSNMLNASYLFGDAVPNNNYSMCWTSANSSATFAVILEFSIYRFVSSIRPQVVSCVRGVDCRFNLVLGDLPSSNATMQSIVLWTETRVGVSCAVPPASCSSCVFAVLDSASLSTFVFNKSSQLTIGLHQVCLQYQGVPSYGPVYGGALNITRADNLVCPSKKFI